jgi:multidrug efflux pump subunit AcrA (membrane-fusion protein)
VTAVGYSVLAKIDIVSECRAVARPTSHIIRVLSDRNGYMEAIFIEEGQKVQRNAPLFLIRSKEALTYRSKVEELRHSIPLKRTFYDTKISAAADALGQLKTDHENALKVKQLKLEQNSLSLDTIASDVAYWKKEIDLYSQEHHSAAQLYKEGIISIREYNYTKTRLEKARTEVEKLGSQKEITLKENRIIEEEISKEKEAYRSRRVALEKELKNLRIETETVLAGMQKELETNEKMLSLQDGRSHDGLRDSEKEEIIRAENAGTVSELYHRNIGDYIRESDLLCTILPADRPLYMDITVPNKDIGFVEEGMKIKYKFDAYPYTDYGVLHGKVLAISPSAVEDGASGMVYHVQGGLDKTHFEIKKRAYPVKAGMTVTAELVTEKKSLFSIMFKKLRE